MLYDNHPIQSTVKGVRKKWMIKIGPLAWAALKELRENNKTKQLFPNIDPYVEVYRYYGNVYAIYEQSLAGCHDMWIYVINGPEKAMVIDTGFGIGNLKGLVEMLVGNKELIVVNTHGHIDHSSGNCQFGKVYCHEYDVPMLKKQDSSMWDSLKTMEYFEFDPDDLISFQPYEIVPFQDGQKWDLGKGYEIEAIWLGGHSPGSCALLDKQNRILFSGDDIQYQRVVTGSIHPNPNVPFGEYNTVGTLRDNLRKLSARLNEFDYCMPGHLMLNFESHMILSMLDTLDKICEDPDYYHFTTEGFHGPVRNTWVIETGTRIGFSV